MNLKVWYSKEIQNKYFLETEVDYYFNKIFGISILEENDKEKSDIQLIIDKDLNSIATDTIKIDFFNGRGSISSNSQVGLLIGIYRFFSEFGVRYLRPGRENELIIDRTYEEFINKKYIFMKRLALITEEYVLKVQILMRM